MENFQNPNNQEDPEDPEGLDSDEQQESMLTSTALTLNYEGLSKDIQYLVDKKVHLVTNTFKNLSNIFVALNSSTKRNTESYLPGSKKEVKELFSHIISEFKGTCDLIDNLIIQEMDDRDDLSEDEVTVENKKPAA